MIETYAEYGAIGVVVVLFSFMIIRMTKKLDQIDEANLKIDNVEKMVIKLIDRWNRSDEVRDRRHEDLTKELHEQSDSLSYLKGKSN